MPPSERSEPTDGPHGGYEEWADFLSRWSQGESVDCSRLGTLYQQDFQGETWARLTLRITEALNRRFESWHSALAGAADAAFADESAYDRALRQGRDGVGPIRALAGDRRFPEELRTHLLRIVDGLLEQAQAQLEEHVRGLGDHGETAPFVEARLLALRSNALTAAIAPTLPGAAAANPPPAVDAPRRPVVRP